MNESKIKITHGALDETAEGEIILRGVIDPASLKLIEVPRYQRETLPLSSLAGIIEALRVGRFVDDVTLGMRGGDFLERSGDFYLKDTVVVIDGLQRISSALHLIQSGQNDQPHLGCVCRFNTEEESEKELFRILNTAGTKLAPAVLIRNLKDDNEAVATIFSLCHDNTCVLYDRVSWQQRMRRNELMTALILLKTVGGLHSGYGPCLATRYSDVANGLVRVMRDVIGRNIFRENIRTFFDVIDGAWGVRSVSFKAEASHLKGNFLFALAAVFAQHRNFWDENKRLTVPSDLRKKIASFPINDPNVRAFAGGGAAGRKALYLYLVEHLNAGKRTHRLMPFKASDSAEFLNPPPSVDAVA